MYIEHFVSGIFYLVDGSDVPLYSKQICQFDYASVRTDQYESFLN